MLKNKNISPVFLKWNTKQIKEEKNERWWGKGNLVHSHPVEKCAAPGSIPGQRIFFYH